MWDRSPSDGRLLGAVSRRGFLRASVLVGGTAAVSRAAVPGGGGLGGATLDVRDFGAVGDGRTKDTAALQYAIDTVHRRGGGVVHLPAGTWVSGTLHLRSGLTIDLAPGAVLLASPDRDDFAPHEELPFESDSNVDTMDFARALLAGCDLERIAIRGGRRDRHEPRPALRPEADRAQALSLRDRPGHRRSSAPPATASAWAGARTCSWKASPSAPPSPTGSTPTAAGACASRTATSSPTTTPSA